MSTITVHVEEKLKKAILKNTKKQGVTMTFLVNQLFSAYNEGKIGFEMITEDERYALLSSRLTEVASRKINVKKLPSLRDQLSDI